MCEMFSQCSDPTSGLRRVEVAIGKSKTTEDVLPWTAVADHAHPTLVVSNVPDGTDLWVRVRLTNKGKLYIFVLYLRKILS